MEALRSIGVHDEAADPDGQGHARMSVAQVSQPRRQELQASRAAARLAQEPESCEMQHPFPGLPRQLQLSIQAMVATGLVPGEGWHKETGVKASVIRDYARSREMQLFRLAYLYPQAVTTDMLLCNYRQRLLAQLDQADDLSALSSIGRLLEKLPEPRAARTDQEGGLDRLTQLCRSTELLIERVRDSTELLALQDDEAETAGAAQL